MNAKNQKIAFGCKLDVGDRDAVLVWEGTHRTSGFRMGRTAAGCYHVQLIATTYSAAGTALVDTGAEVCMPSLQAIDDIVTMFIGLSDGDPDDDPKSKRAFLAPLPELAQLARQKDADDARRRILG